MEEEEPQIPESKQGEPAAVYQVGTANLQAQARIRPSTTGENIRRNIMKHQRRKLVSGHQNNYPQNQLRQSHENPTQQPRFGNYQAQPYNEKSAGVITTVQHQ